MNTIKQKRKLTGLTQLQFAQKIGIPLRTYMRYEAEKNSKEYREPKAKLAVIIAEALGTTVKELWGYQGEQN